MDATTKKVGAWGIVGTVALLGVMVYADGGFKETIQILTNGTRPTPFATTKPVVVEKNAVYKPVSTGGSLKEPKNNPNTVVQTVDTALDSLKASDKVSTVLQTLEKKGLITSTFASEELQNNKWSQMVSQYGIVKEYPDSIRVVSSKQDSNDQSIYAVGTKETVTYALKSGKKVNQSQSLAWELLNVNGKWEVNSHK